MNPCELPVILSDNLPETSFVSDNEKMPVTNLKNEMSAQRVLKKPQTILEKKKNSLTAKYANPSSPINNDNPYISGISEAVGIIDDLK